MLLALPPCTNNIFCPFFGCSQYNEKVGWIQRLSVAEMLGNGVSTLLWRWNAFPHFFHVFLCYVVKVDISLNTDLKMSLKCCRMR